MAVDEELDRGVQTETLKEYLIRSERTEMEVGRQACARDEKQRSGLARELDEPTELFKDTRGTVAAQVDLNKNREDELQKLRRNLDEASLGQETTAIGLCGRYADAIAEMGDRVDRLWRLGNSSERERQSLSRKLLDLTRRHGGIVRGRAAAEKLSKQLKPQFADCNDKIEETVCLISRSISPKQRLQAESGDLLCWLEDAEHRVGALLGLRRWLGRRLGEAKRTLEEESRAETAPTSAFKKAQADLDFGKEQLEEEVETRGELHRALSKTTIGAQMGRTRDKQEDIARTAAYDEELGEAKRKPTIKSAEAEEQFKPACGRCSSLGRRAEADGSTCRDMRENYEKFDERIQPRCDESEETPVMTEEEAQPRREPKFVQKLGGRVPTEMEDVGESHPRRSDRLRGRKPEFGGQ